MTSGHHLEHALEQAKLGVEEGGMPFGAALVVNGELVAVGRNRQIQDGDYFSHAETNCLAGYIRQPFARGENAVMIATEAPCPMCAGAIVVTGIEKLVVGEDVHYAGALDWLQAQGVEVEVVGHQGCIDVVADFRDQHPQKWNMFSAG